MQIFKIHPTGVFTLNPVRIFCLRRRKEIITEKEITYLYYYSAHKTRALSEMPLQNVCKK
jgi:hypothetical protein